MLLLSVTLVVIMVLWVDLRLPVDDHGAVVGGQILWRWVARWVRGFQVGG